MPPIAPITLLTPEAVKGAMRAIGVITRSIPGAARRRFRSDETRMNRNGKCVTHVAWRPVAG